jgi:peptidoglycan/xylan/chitin deacetylase (PgdA/CDA1 family)
MELAHRVNLQPPGGGASLHRPTSSPKRRTGSFGRIARVRDRGPENNPVRPLKRVRALITVVHRMGVGSRVNLTSPLKGLARRAGIRRAQVAAIRMRAERSFLSLRSGSEASITGRVLCYHGLDTPRWGANSVTTAQFRGHIERALSLGYRFVPAQVVASGHSSRQDLAVTFDDGLLSVATKAAPILAEYRVPWTLFVVAGWADGRHSFGDGVIMGWAEVERLASQGVQIGSHSLSHPDFGSLTGADAYRELSESRRLIQARTGIEASSFAIPFGRALNWSDQAQTAAKDVGYEVVFANCESLRPPGTSPRTMISRFDTGRIFDAALAGAFDDWQEWIWVERKSFGAENKKMAQPATPSRSY